MAWVAFVFLSTVQVQNLPRGEQAAFGKTAEGAEVKLITLRNAKGLSAQIISYGAIIKELHGVFGEVGAGGVRLRRTLTADAGGASGASISGACDC